jgi:hypothetical protein
MRVGQLEAVEPTARLVLKSERPHDGAPACFNAYVHVIRAVV